MKRKENEFNFTFNGQLDSIEVRSLTGSLLALNELIKDVSYELGTNKKVELTIKTYKPGSFDVFLQLIADGLAVGGAIGLFNGNNVQIAQKVIETAVSVLNLKKFLKGKKPEQTIQLKDNRIKIKNRDGNVIIIEKVVFDMSSNENIDKHIKEVFKAIENKETVTGISIKDHKEEVAFESKKDDGTFDFMLDSNPILEDEEDVEENDKIIDDATLSVYTLTFGDTKKWEFYYEGNKIPVRLLDIDFMDKVINREYHFANGDRIKCKLIVHQKWNKIAMVYENKSYSIIEVYGAPIPPNPQGKLDL